MSNDIDKIRYTTLNGIMVPELTDILAYIGQQSHPTDYMTLTTDQTVRANKTVHADYWFATNVIFNSHYFYPMVICGARSTDSYAGAILHLYPNANTTTGGGGSWSLETRNTNSRTLVCDSDGNLTFDTPSASPRAKVLTSNDLSLQIIYDALMPVDTIILGFTQPNVPTGVTATWSDVSSTYNGRYLKVDSSNSAGTSQSESLPKPTVTTTVTVNSVTTTSTGAHTHTRPNINPGTNYINTNHTSGATYQVPTRSSSYTSNTGSSGAHTHTFTPTASATSTVSGSVYAASAAVRPLTTTIKVWKRTA